MKHAYIAEYSQPDREPKCPTSFNFDFELNQDIEKKSKIRELMREEMAQYPLSSSSSSSFSSSAASSSSSSSAASSSSSSTRKSDIKKTASTSTERITKRDRGTPTSRGSGVGSSEKKRPNNRHSTSPRSPRSPRSSRSPPHSTKMNDKSSLSSSPSSLVSPPPAPFSSTIDATNTTNATSATSAIATGTKQEVARELRAAMSSIVTSLSTTNQEQMSVMELSILNAMSSMERRIISKMENIIDTVVTRRFLEFEKKLEGEDEEEDFVESPNRENGKGLSRVRR